MHTLTARGLGRTGVALAAALLLVLIVLGVVRAAPLPSTDPFPRLAFVARNDVPFDSLAIGPIAGAVGGIVVITSPTSLSDAARQTLVDFAPDTVVIAGGRGAVSDAVAAQIDAAGPWDVVRKAGAGRDQTAAALATVLTDLGVGRPALTGARQVVGDVRVGGLVHADTLRSQGAAVLGGPLTAPSITWSTPRQHVHTVSQFAFQPTTSSGTYTNFNGGVTGGPTALVAPLQLPDGARVIELRAAILDSNATHDTTVELITYPIGIASFALPVTVSTTGSSTTYQTPAATPSSPLVVDNGTTMYGLIAWGAGSWADQRLQAVTITYTLPGPS
jgi:hypothetical protein